MNLFPSELELTRQLVQQSDWYLHLGTFRQTRLLGLGAVQAASDGNIAQAADEARLRLLVIFEQLLDAGDIRLGRKGEEELDDQDKDRQPIDTIVIHHSSHAEGLSLSTLNAMHLLQLYVPVYRNPKEPVLNSKGEHQPIYSGHFDQQGKQVFYGYHWKVGQDGSAIRLLDDSALAWHAANWDVNKRSIGICIDDDLEYKDPTPASLDAVATIIKTHYDSLHVSEKSIVGHNEVARSKTVCPGDGFLDHWKLELLSHLR